ncbi:MAG: hypothetical protein HOP19_03725 [Acidobacteria bacterium]|nr:hypothetical protein [Acidobacteriota bacterium]
MNKYEHPFPIPNRPPAETPEAPGTDAYAPAVESLSGKWREVQTTGTPSQSKQRNTTMWGVGIGIALVIFLALVGGFLLLVWTVNR